MSDRFGHSFIELFERARQPEALALFTDNQLARLLDHRALPAAVTASALGELLLRRWLYCGEWPERLATVYEGRVPLCLKTAMGALKQHAPPGDSEFAEPVAGSAWGIFAQRAKRFLAAHGVIALLAGREGSEAVPVPFRLLPNLPREDRVHDLAGNSFPRWSSAVLAIEAEYGEDLGFLMEAVIPGDGSILEGSSFGLPLVVARARICGAIASYPVLRVLATGAVCGGRIEPVQGVPVKAALASRIGACFMASGAPHAGSLNLPQGTTLKEALRRIDAELVAQELATLTPQQAYDAICATAHEVHLGILKLGDAERRIARCADALHSAPAGRFVEEGVQRIAVLRAAIANHLGDPVRSRCELEKVRCSSANARNPCLYVEAIASEVVAMTDLGFLSDAERIGRELLEWVHEEMKGDLRDRLRCEMIASGALGGQPLLHSALRDLSRADEGRHLLQQAVDFALELELGAEICRGYTQFALWQALIEPAEFGTAFAQAKEVLARHAPAERRVSRAYLLRTRFLAAYRLLVSGAPAEDVTGWELPDRNIGHASWLHATALKYRGTLYAACGAAAEAKNDFTSAVTLLSQADAPLLRFIGGTAALQAAESLAPLDHPAALGFLTEAQAIFCGFENPPGPALESAEWIRRCEALRTSGTVAFAPNPQRQFPY